MSETEVRRRQEATLHEGLFAALEGLCSAASAIVTLQCELIVVLREMRPLLVPQTKEVTTTDSAH